MDAKKLLGIQMFGLIMVISIVISVEKGKSLMILLALMIFLNCKFYYLFCTGNNFYNIYYYLVPYFLFIVTFIFYLFFFF